MSARIVVSVQENEHGDLQVLLFRAPRLFDDARIAHVLQLPHEGFPALGPPDGVREYGQKLFRALTGHDAIRQALGDAVNRPERTPIFFYCTAPDAERLAWETLCDDAGEFLALSRNRPIGRWADSLVDTGSEQVAWQPPLKVLAVLSALPFPAEPEWQTLYEAVQSARTDDFPIDLKVLVGEEELLETIRDLDDPWVSADPVPQHPVDLVMAIEEFGPQILHFFCHGTAAYGRPSLELASLRDWARKDQPDAEPGSHGSVRLNVTDLTTSQLMQGAWLVTLNCCEGARASEEVHSLAHSLVSGGVGAAVGMLEPFDANDAHEFCGRFYPGVFGQVRDLFEEAEVGSVFEIDWASCLYPPRRALSDGDDGDPGGVKRWALPVLYTPPDRFSVRLSQADDPESALRARVDRDVVEGLLSILSDDAPDHILSGAREILTDAETTLFGEDVG
jgi:hypothetical protein